jgi:hypothetical protein
LLEKIPDIERRPSSPQAFLVIDTTRNDSSVPDAIGRDGSYKLLDDLSDLVQQNEGGATGGEDDSAFGNFEGERLNALMKLFRFIIQQNYE